MKKLISMLLAMALVFGTIFSNPMQANAYSVSKNMKWWSSDRFGMFIHFGAYSYYGQGEWAMHEQKISKKKYQTTIAAKFNPTKFNADAIVSAAKKAGMKYIVITAKHHEGLAMWDTKVSSFKDYTGTKIFSLQQYTPFGSTQRDVLMELKNACKKAGIKFGLYYSIIDWNHPSQQISGDFTKMSSMTARKNYISDMKAQLQELVTTYDPDIMWFDGDWTYRKKSPTLSSWWTKADGQDLYKYMKKISPSIIVNERVCRGFNLGDFACPEQTIPSKPLERSWETCQTMNDAWGYKKANEKQYSSSKLLTRQLVETVSKDGNYLLNIGPKGNGEMTNGSLKVLKEIGKWMNTYSASIYGNKRSPFKKPSWGRYTRNGKIVYAHVLKWPKNKKIIAKYYKKSSLKISKIYLVGKSEKKLKYNVKGTNITIKLPKKVVNKTDTVIAIKYKAK